MSASLDVLFGMLVRSETGDRSFATPDFPRRCRRYRATISVAAASKPWRHVQLRHGFWMLIVAALAATPTETSQNLTGQYCQGKRWRRWRGVLWGVAQGRYGLGILKPHPVGMMDDMSTLMQCPEGVVAANLAMYARVSGFKALVVSTLAHQVTMNFNAATLLWRIKHGGWPDFGVSHVLERDVFEARNPVSAHLLINTTPRLVPVLNGADSNPTPPAPHIVQQGWWWSREETLEFKGLQVSPPDGTGKVRSSVDFGMQLLLTKTPILRQRPGLLLVDVGVFDGSSLLSLGLEAGMNHSVLGFEPMPSNRHMVFAYFESRGLLETLTLLEPDTRSCYALDIPRNSLVESRTCRCSAHKGGCATLAKVGLAASDTSTETLAAGALTSVAFSSFGGWSVSQRSEKVRLRVGAPIIEWWSREVLGRSCVDVHLLKIDVEGSEFNALRGLEPLLAEHRVHFIFLEFWPWALTASGTDPVGVLRWLAHYGYLCRTLGTHISPQSFEKFVAMLMPEKAMSDFRQEEMKFQDLLCEDLHWRDPCSGQ
eukprot:TRINITY_DN56631_c0_g1_i1.p1 TRINITY_DN56631_c0_g1~~TRINITY_DN56631_c0_g1_i1.p1  ORF type:complete len:540 (-),score=74.77 TRINITY_DN56631_c0_g1_i1:99-1718(-)